jgi:hypothetical protein
LCINDYAAQSLPRHLSTQGLHPADRVFVIEPPLPASSLSLLVGCTLTSPLSLLADASPPALLLLHPAQPQHQRCYLVPTYFVYFDNRMLRFLTHCSTCCNRH